jgi:hypothetical protein
VKGGWKKLYYEELHYLKKGKQSLNRPGQDVRVPNF